jgi:hypothetical protein
VKDLVVHDSQLVTNHALGLVDDLESLRALEAHLAGCAQCCQEWEDVRDTLALAAEHIPPEFFDTTRADPDDDLIFQRTLGAVRQEKRAKARHRWLRPVAAAAMALIALIGGGFAVGRATAPSEPPAVVQAEGGRTIQGTGVGGATMAATLTPFGESVRLAVTASGFPRGARCHLVVVTADGRREPAGSWTVPAAGAPAGGVSLTGSAAVDISQVRAVAVDADTGAGEPQELIYLQA